MHNRVTAEEFIAAINMLEARKNEEAQKLAGTVDVEETIRELGIDASPDELLAEVQAQRAKKLAELKARQEAMKPPPTPFQQSYPYVQPPPLAGPKPPSGIPLEASLPHSNPSQVFAPPTARIGSGGRRRQFLGPLISGIVVVIVATNMAGHLGTGIKHLFATAPPPPGQTIPLAQLPEGQVGYASTSEIKDLIASNDVPTATMKVHSNNITNTWPVIKTNGHFYLGGFVLDADKVLPGNTVDIYNDDNAGELHGVNEDTVTIPLDNVHMDNSWQGPTSSELTLTNVHPDEHLRDDLNKKD